MHRAIARLLLVLLLVGVLAPVALAISAAPPHACCLRKPMHGRPSHDAQLQALLGCCQHDCCRASTVSQSAHLRSSASRRVRPACTILQSGRRSTPLSINVNDAHSGRAPPQFSIA
jgi:hypothetical protein